MAEKKKSYAPEIDVEEITGLLDVVHSTLNMPNLASLNRAAILKLVEINEDITEALEELMKQKAEDEAEAKAKAEEEAKAEQAKYKEKQDA